MNGLKKIIAMLLAVCTAFFACACTNSDKDFEAKKVAGEFLKVGDSFSVSGVGDFTLDKIYTTQKLQSSLHFGTYMQPVGEDMQYIDMVFRFKNKKADMAASAVGNISAVGELSGVEYTDYITAVETDDNKSLSTTEKPSTGSTVTLHMAVEVPIGAEETYKLKIHLRTATYEASYTPPNLDESMERIYEGQSMSNTQLKVKLDKIGYSRKLYDGAPKNSDCAKDKIYLVAEMTVLNKAFEDTDFEKLVSVCALYGGESYDMEYMMSEDGKKYVAKGVVKGLGETKLIAAVVLPLEYSEKDADVVFAIDFEEFLCEVEGSDDFTREPEPVENETKTNPTTDSAKNEVTEKAETNNSAKINAAEKKDETKVDDAIKPEIVEPKAPETADDEVEIDPD